MAFYKVYIQHQHSELLQHKHYGSCCEICKSALTVSPTQLVIDPGKIADKDLRGGEYLEIIKMSGLHSGSNAITGDFSFGIEGVLYRGHEIIEYVKEVTVSGNFFQILNQIADFGNTLHANTAKSFFSPIIRFKGLSVAENKTLHIVARPSISLRSRVFLIAQEILNGYPV